MSRRVPAFLLGAVLLSHLPLLRAGYVQDDHAAVEWNPVLERGVGAVVAASYWEDQRGADRSLYRPLTVATYALERAALGRPVAAASHASNLLLHAAVCWVLYAIAVRLGLAPRAALLAALLFAVWPAKSEAVANVVGRAELLAALFTLLAVRLGLARATRAAAWGAGACVLLACTAKETGLAALPLLGLAAFTAEAPRRRAIDVAGMVLPGILALVLFAIARTFALEAFFPPQTVPVIDNPLVAEEGVRGLATALGLIARYARIAALPWGLSNDYSGATVAIETTVVAWRPLLGLALAVAAGALATQSRTLVLAVAVAGIPYLLVGNLFVPVGAILAERFLYLPLAGTCLLAAAGIDRYGRIAERAAFVVLAIFAVLMLLRALDWRDDATIFAATARHNPKSPRAPFWLGSLAVEAGRPEIAGPQFDAAIRNWPAFAPAWHAKGILLARAGDGAGAARAIAEAIRLEPGWASPHLNMALVLHRAGDRTGALKSARKAALLDPEDATTWAEIGHLAFETGDYLRAAGAYERAIARGRSDLAGRLAEARARL